jgi:ferredoxin-NADP reductase
MWFGLGTGENEDDSATSRDVHRYRIVGSGRQQALRSGRLQRVRATVKEKREVAERTLLAVFDLDGQEVDFRPGQYFWVELPDRGYDDEKGLRRHISVVTSPTERGVLGLATRIRDSAFKRTLAELQVGDEVDVEEPKGSFVLPEDTSRPYVFIAGGIGITVFRSMLRYIADTHQPYRVTLVYSNRNRAAAAFLDELEELRSRIPGLDVVLVFTDEPGWEGESRHVDADVLRDHLAEPLDAYTYMVAGPPGMAEDVGEKVRAAGVPEEQVVVAKFSGY